MRGDRETGGTTRGGATGGMASAMLALVDPGDEVIVFEPFYENYGPDTILCGARPVYVPLAAGEPLDLDRKSTRLNSSHSQISYAVFCLKKKNTKSSSTYSTVVSSQRL